MDELIAFMRAQLDEDEAIAREAAGLTECWVAEEPAIGVVLVDGEPLIEGHITGLTAHIARHDPARVLREIEAKRRIVDRYAEALADLERAKRIAPRRTISDTDLIDTQRELDILRPVVEALVAVWCDHPGYREERKP